MMINFNKCINDIIIKDLEDNGYTLLTRARDKTQPIVYTICKDKNFNSIIGLLSEYSNTITIMSKDTDKKINDICFKYNTENVKFEQAIGKVSNDGTHTIFLVAKLNNDIIKFNKEIVIGDPDIVYRIVDNELTIRKQTHLLYLPIDGVDNMFDHLIRLFYNKFIYV